VIKPGLVPVGIALHARRIGDAQLPSDEVDHHSRHVQRVLQDLSMALLGAVSCVMPGPNPGFKTWPSSGPRVETRHGVLFPEEPRPREWDLSAFRWPEGAERANAA